MCVSPELWKSNEICLWVNFHREKKYYCYCWHDTFEIFLDIKVKSGCVYVPERDRQRLTVSDSLFTLWQRLNFQCSFDLSCIISGSKAQGRSEFVRACVSECDMYDPPGYLNLVSMDLAGRFADVSSKDGELSKHLSPTHTHTFTFKGAGGFFASEVENTHYVCFTECLYWCGCTYSLCWLSWRQYIFRSWKVKCTCNVSELMLTPELQQGTLRKDVIDRVEEKRIMGRGSHSLGGHWNEVFWEKRSPCVTLIHGLMHSLSKGVCCKL